MNIRPIRADEWRELREIRLHALADTPSAFGSTFAEENERPDDWWRERAALASRALDRVTFVAEDGTRFRGLATGFRESATHTHVHLFSMWVEPAARRSGVARGLVQAVCEWARGLEARSVRLGVTVTNAPAIRLYESCGFAPTGRTEPLPHTPTLLEQEMERVL
ncbi:MAG: hypothetical protein AUH85_03925 [Chloroflexi bacterium 13_1_40CM_4_68_4]|nr:MAG: hypothetical protein AUH85_03925 [Chloroflexi bacterium 13_1_40CM_4_68_4]